MGQIVRIYLCVKTPDMLDNIRLHLIYLLLLFVSIAFFSTGYVKIKMSSPFKDNFSLTITTNNEESSDTNSANQSNVVLGNLGQRSNNNNIQAFVNTVSVPLNIRIEQNINSRIIGEIQSGTVIIVSQSGSVSDRIEQQGRYTVGKWVNVTYKGIKGYVFDFYLEYEKGQ